ncbi:nuclear transport factor 2 family protein [Lapillicoccus sp.]|uniref:nuclear transport factor 2 family protein n=1 Tax=Lapillicoccus sp. TaxID=1909287 RepID=UPI0039831B17
MIDSARYASLLEHFARYFAACDGYDLDTVMDILQGATVTSGGVTTTDPLALRDFYATRQPPPLADGRRVTKHHVTNLIVEGPDDDGVTAARAYYFRLEPGDHVPSVAASGRLEQAVVREGSRWRVLRHSILSDF